MTLSEFSITIPRVAFLITLIAPDPFAAERCRSVGVTQAKRSYGLEHTPLANIAYGIPPVSFGNTSYRELGTDVEGDLGGVLFCRHCRFVGEREWRSQDQGECHEACEYAEQHRYVDPNGILSLRAGLQIDHSVGYRH